MLPSFFRKTIVIDGWNDVWRAPTGEEAMEVAVNHAERLGLAWRTVAPGVIEIDGCEYDVVAARMFRGSFGVKLIRR